MNKRTGVILVLLVVLVIVLLPYLRAGFLLDDYLHIDRAMHARGAGVFDYAIDSNEIGVHLWWVPPGVQVRFVRPAASALLAVEARVFGANAAPFHAVSLVLHLINIFLCYAIGRRIGLTAVVSAVTAIAWGISIHTVLAAGWVSGQSELLAACFVLWSVVCFLRAGEGDGRRWWVAGIVLFALGLLSRESAVVAPLLFLIIQRSSSRRNRAFITAAFSLVAVYLAVRYFLHIPLPPPPYFQPVENATGLLHLPVKLLRYVAGAGLGIPVVPLVLESGKQLLIVALAGAVVWWALVRLSGRRLPWELVWLVAALIPYVLIMPVSLYLYIGLCGVYWLIGRALQQGSILARVWIAWLIVVGMAGHLVAADFMRGVAASIRDAGAAVARDNAADVVLVNAPFWAYCLPASVRLEDSSAGVRVHVVDLAPAVRGDAARIRRLSDNQFDVERGTPGFFQSPIERFFLFGSSPCTGGTGDDLIDVSCAGDDPAAPRVLEVTLHRDARVFVFDSWRMREWLP